MAEAKSPPEAEQGLYCGRADKSLVGMSRRHEMTARRSQADGIIPDAGGSAAARDAYAAQVEELTLRLRDNSSVRATRSIRTAASSFAGATQEEIRGPMN